MILNRPYLTMGEHDYLIDKTEQTRDKLLQQWLSRSGVRISELLQLETKDINLEQRLVRIIHQKVRSRLKCPKCKGWVGKSHLFCPKCGGDLAYATSGNEGREERRTIPIDSETLRLTAEYIDLSGHKSRRVFDISRQRADQIIKEAARRVKLDYVLDFYSGKKTKLHCHTFRHSFSMHWLLKNGTNMESVTALSRHLGHKDIKTTMRYLHWMPEEIRKDYEKLFE